MPRRVRPATKVVVFQCPWGTAMRKRSPRGAQPWGAGHVGLGPCLIDEHQPVGVEAGLAVAPGVPAHQHIRTVPAPPRGRSFFSRDAMAHKEALYRLVTEGVAPLPESRAQLLDGHVRLLLKKAQDHAALRLDPARATVAAKRLRARVALLPFQRAPTAHARRAHTETRPGCPVAHARANRRQNANTKIKGKRFRHHRRPPPSGRHLESQIQGPVNPQPIQSAQITL